MHRVCQAVDCGTIAAIVSVLAGWLPTIAVILPLIWWGIKIYKEIRDWKKNPPD